MKKNCFYFPKSFFFSFDEKSNKKDLKNKILIYCISNYYSILLKNDKKITLFNFISKQIRIYIKNFFSNNTILYTLELEFIEVYKIFYLAIKSTILQKKIVDIYNHINSIINYFKK